MNINERITKIFEDDDFDNLEDGMEDVGEREEESFDNSYDKTIIAKTIRRFKEGKVNQERTSKTLRRIASEKKNRKSISIIADFVDILNKSTDTGNIINTGAFRKLSRTLGIKPGILDNLSPEDKFLATKLIYMNYKSEQ